MRSVCERVVVEAPIRVVVVGPSEMEWCSFSGAKNMVIKTLPLQRTAVYEVIVNLVGSGIQSCHQTLCLLIEKTALIKCFIPSLSVWEIQAHLV
jgi:hypothetical protein